MGTVDVKGGLSSSFFGAVVGVMLLIILNVITSGMGGESVQIIPSLTFDGNLFGFIGDFLGYFFTTTNGLIVLVGTILFYIVATYYVQKSKATPPDPAVVENDTAALMRGLLIGFASSMNFVLAYNIYGEWFSETAGLIIAIVLFALGILATIKAVSQNGFYQGVIGWISWAAPMSWPVLLVGLIFAVLSLVLGLIGLAGVDFLRVGGDSSADPKVKDKVVTAHWSTGTFFLVGGLVGNVNFQKTAFNMGNLAFIHRKAQADHRDHEAGHNLNLFAFGWIVHYIGAIDENIVGYKARALTELLAESHDGSSHKDKVQMWA